MTTPSELGRQAAQAAERFHAAVYPGDELRGPRSDLPPALVETFDSVIAALTNAEDAFDPGVGSPKMDEGKARLSEVAETLRALEGFILPGELFVARTDVLRWIGRNL